MQATDTTTRTIHLELTEAEAQALLNVAWGVNWNDSPEAELAQALYAALRGFGLDMNRYREVDELTFPNEP